MSWNNQPLGTVNWSGNTKLIGPPGPPGTSSGLVVYLDSATSTTIPTVGAMLNAPITTAQTTLTYATSSATGVLLAVFPSQSGLLTTTFIPAGLWDFNVYLATTNTTNQPSFYFSLYQVDADGVSNPVLIADGSADAQRITNLASTQTQYNFSLYVPIFNLSDSTKRIQARLYGNYVTGNRALIMEFRNGAIDHIHTSLSQTGIWSPYPATSDVNMAGYSINNVTSVNNSGGTLTENATTITENATTINENATNINRTAPNINDSSTRNINLIIDRGVDVGGDATLNLVAQNGRKGVVNITAGGGYSNAVNGAVTITAEGSTFGTVSQGGLISILANTPLGSTYTTTSAIKMAAASILSYAGAFSPALSLLGYNYIYGTLGVNITANVTPPSIAVPNTAGTVYISGQAGTKITNGLYIDEIHNYNGQDLTISTPPFSGTYGNLTLESFKAMYITATTGTAGVINMNANTTNIQGGDTGGLNLTGGNSYITMNALGVRMNTGLNMTGNTITNVPNIANPAGNITLTPASGSNVQMTSRMNMNGNNIGTIGNLYFNSIDTIAGTATEFIISTHSNMTANVAGDFTVNAANINFNGALVTNGDLNMSNHNITNVSNISDAANAIMTIGTATTLGLNNLVFSNYGGTLGDVKINSYNITIGNAQGGTISMRDNVDMTSHNIMNVNTISSPGNITLSGASGLTINPGTGYASFTGNIDMNTHTIYQASVQTNSIDLLLRANYAHDIALVTDSGRYVNVLGAQMNIQNGNLDMYGNHIVNVTNIGSYSDMYINVSSNFFVNGGGSGHLINLQNGGGFIQIASDQNVYLGGGYAGAKTVNCQTYTVVRDNQTTNNHQVFEVADTSSYTNITPTSANGTQTIRANPAATGISGVNTIYNAGNYGGSVFGGIEQGVSGLLSLGVLDGGTVTQGLEIRPSYMKSYKNLNMNNLNINNVNYIANTTCGFNVTTGTGYGLALTSGGPVNVTAGSGYVINLLSDVNVPGNIDLNQVTANDISASANISAQTFTAGVNYSAVSAYTDAVTFPFYYYAYSQNIGIGDVTFVNVSGTNYNWIFTVPVTGLYVPSHDGAYDVQMYVVLPVNRRDGLDTPYPTLSSDTRYAIALYSDPSCAPAYVVGYPQSGVIGNVNDAAGISFTGGDIAMEIDFFQNMFLRRAQSYYIKVAFLNVGGTHFPNVGTVDYYARRMA